MTAGSGIDKNGFDKDTWIKAYDECSINHEWCQIMKRVTPIDITLEQAKVAVSSLEREVDAIQCQATGRALELGSDWGRFALYKVLNTELEYEAGNVSTNMAEHLRQIAERLGVSDRLRSCIMFAEDIQFPDNTFDIVYAFETLEHVGDLPASLNEIHRVLKPGSYLAFSLPLEDWADSGYHTQRHNHVYWLSKFAEHGFNTKEYRFAKCDLGSMKDGNCGIYGCFAKI